MENLVRLIFIALCVMGVFLIGVSALFEFGRAQRGESLLSPRHFRWRMISAVLWILVLGSFAFATLFLWPRGPGDILMGKRFGAVIAGATLLLIIACATNLYDVVMTLQERGKHQVEFLRDLESLAREEAERAQHQNPPHRKDDTESGDV